MLVYDLDTHEIVDADPGACALYGYTRDELIGLPLAALRPEEDVPYLARELEHRDVARGEVIRRSGIRHLRRDGTEFPVRLEARTVRLGDRRLRMVFIEDAVAALDAFVAEGHALLFRETRDAVVVTDESGRITGWNPAAESLWGWSREEVLGRQAAFLHPPAEGEDVVRRIMSGLEEHGRWEGELQTIARDGEPRNCEVRALALFQADGSVAGTIGINRDITGQRRAEDALLETAEGFRLLADQIPQLVWAADRDGTIQYVNQRWETVTGRDVVEGLGDGWAAATHPDDVDTLREAWHHSLETGEELEVEHRLRSGDGSYRWYVSCAGPIRGTDGEIRRWLGTTADIHEQKAAEDLVRRREEYFRGVFENAHDAIILFDRASTRVVDANPAAETLYGYDRSELLQLSIHDLYPTDEDARSAIAELRNQPGSHVVTQCGRDGEELHVEVNAALMEHRGQGVLLTINRDLTERRQLEQQLHQAQKMEALGRLAGGLAHDFNNLTTAIQGFASLLSEELPQDGSAQEALTEIDRAASRATDLTRQLLAYTRQQVMRGRVLDLTDVVESARHLITRLIGEDVQVVFDLDDGLDPVRADPGQLNQVLLNLAVNARDAMGNGGRLAIETANALLDHEFARQHPPAEPGPYVRLSVVDTGEGMPDEVLEHAFEPFFTTKAVGEGTGLGLATAYGIVKQSGGFIFVTSEVGVGTRFDIYLPRVREEAEELVEPAEPPPTPVAADDASSQTVLLVEDEESVRKLARRVLERAGYAVIEARNGMEALEVSSSDEVIDLVLTDMVMPRMSGKELARQLNLTRPDARVLYMSGYTGESLAERGDLTRTDVILEKPFRPADLVDAVRRRLEDHD